MADASKFSPDAGSTIYDLKDTNGRIMSEQLIRDTVGWTGKNLYEYDLESLKHYNTDGTWNNNEYTYRGVTWTYNDEDKTIIANGTASASYGSLFFLFKEPLSQVLPNYTNPNGFTLNGAPADGYWNTYFQRLENETKRDLSFDDFGSGKTKIISSWESTDIVKHYLGVDKNITANNLKFSPMLRDARITDSTYEPYHDNVSTEITDVYKVMGEMGAKNLIRLPYVSTSSVIGGITFTVNNDGSIKGNGTNTSGNIIEFTFENNTNQRILPLLAGKKVTITGGKSASKNVDIWINGYGHITDNGDGITATIPTITGDYNFKIRINAGEILDNEIFYPMMRLASDPDSTYQPYAMTNRELTGLATPQTIDLTIDAGLTYTNVSVKSVRQNSGIISINLLMTGVVLPSGYTTISTLPAGSRPTIEFLKNINFNNGTKGYLRVKTSGGIQISPQTAGTMDIYICESIVL